MRKKSYNKVRNYSTELCDDSASIREEDWEASVWRHQDGGDQLQREADDQVRGVRQGVGRPQQPLQAQEDPHRREASQVPTMSEVRSPNLNHISWILIRRFIQRYNMKQHYKTHKGKKPILKTDEDTEINKHLPVMAPSSPPLWNPPWSLKSPRDHPPCEAIF